MKKYLIYMLLIACTLFFSCKKEVQSADQMLLKAKYTVVLGAENSNQAGYLVTSTATPYVGAAAEEHKEAIDITFGKGDLDNTSFISPKERTNVGLTFGDEDGVSAIETVFNEVVDVENLDDPKINATYISNISTTGEVTLAVELSKTYSFSNSLGKKGLIYVNKLEGAGADMILEVSVIVQN